MWTISRAIFNLMSNHQCNIGYTIFSILHCNSYSTFKPLNLFIFAKCLLLVFDCEMYFIGCMCSICKRVGMEWNGSIDNVICRDNIDVIYDTFFLALKDYTLDSRGDVGRW